MSLLSEVSKTVLRANVVETALMRAQELVVGLIVVSLAVIIDFQVNRLTINEQLNASTLDQPSSFGATSDQSAVVMHVSGAQTGMGVGAGLEVKGAAAIGTGMDISATTANDNAVVLDASGVETVGSGIVIAGTGGSVASVALSGESTNGQAVTLVAASASGSDAVVLEGNSTNAAGVRIVGTNTADLENGGLRINATADTAKGIALTAGTSSTSGGAAVHISGTATDAATAVTFASTSEVFSARSPSNDGVQLMGTSDGANGAVACDVSAGTISLLGTNETTSAPALVLDATLTNASTTRPPIILNGGTAGTNFASVIGAQFGNTLPVVEAGDADYVLDQENQMGVVILYGTTLTDNRTVTLPLDPPTEYDGMAHVFVVRQAGGAFALNIDAQGGNLIVGTSATSAVGITNVSAQSIGTPATVENASVHLTRGPGGGRWNADIISEFM